LTNIDANLIIYFNHTILLLKRLGIILMIYTILRIVFLLLNQSYFQNVDFKIFIGGLRYDMATICMINLPFAFFSLLPIYRRDCNGYKLFLKIIFYLSNIPFLFVACIDLEYFKFTFKRSTYDILSMVSTGTDTAHMIPQFLKDYWYIGLIFLFLSWAFNQLYKRIVLKQELSDFNSKYVIIHTLLLAFFTGLFLLISRGGPQLRPIGIINASTYADAKNISLVLNTPFTLIKSFGKTSLEELNYFSENEAKKYFDPNKDYAPFTKDFNQNNVVLILLESFSKEWIGALNDSLPGYTPFLDSLIPYCLSIEKSFANGKKSMEAFPSVLASIPSLMESPYITSAYSGNKINSLASILKQNGYNSSFYHGGANGTMGFDGFCKIAGFDSYYGANEYPESKDNDGAWGIYDEPYLQYFANELSKKQEPFFAGVFTLSSHHPYSVPEKYKSNFKGGEEPITKTIQYTDYSLKLFFEKSKNLPWFKNTLFVITADHTSTSNNYFYSNSMGSYAVPILFYKQNYAFTPIPNAIVEHVDIMPSILHLLGINRPFISFGKSIFSDEKKFMVNYLNGIYWMVIDDYLVQYDGEKTIGFYDYKKDPLLSDNLLEKEFKKSIEPTAILKAYLQQFNQRLLMNNTILE
jgi:phosphoglycerol transferase MdoB-like AlkP superfamily enzyme